MSSRQFISLSALAALLVVGCSDGSDSTTGKRVELHTAVNPDVTTEFTTGFGWDVKLERAAVASAGFYYFDGPPPTAIRAPHRSSLGERFASLFVGTAWAHPGHYQAGTALGQVIFPKPLVLDLFDEPTLPDGDGVTGTYRSARFLIAQAAPDSERLAGHIAVAEGSAVKHDGSSAAPVYFRMVADYADITQQVNDGAVDGCVLDEIAVSASGTVTLTIDPAIWLNLVDFSKLDPGAENSRTEARDDGFSQGVTQLSAYHFVYSNYSGDRSDGS